MLLIGLLLALAISGCAVASPSPTSTTLATVPQATASTPASAGASSTPLPTAAGSWTATGSLLEPRAGHTATLLLDGAVLVAGGGGGGPGILSTAELYDPKSGSWTATGDMVEGRYGHTATLLHDGTVLVAGGSVEGLPSAELYDPGSRTWTAVGPMMALRYNHTATLLQNGQVLVAGGYFVGSDHATPLASAELYDPDMRTWSATSAMSAARYDHTATFLPFPGATPLATGAVLVAGGVGEGNVGEGYVVLASAELYDPTAGRWEPTGSLTTPRSRAAAALLRDLTVLVVGYGDEAVSAERYEAGAWAAAGDIDTLDETTATLLADGGVLIVGGAYGTPGWAARYDPASGSWMATRPMMQPRGPLSLTLLLDGTVLAAGGSDGLDPMALAEIFDPSS